MKREQQAWVLLRLFVVPKKRTSLDTTCSLSAPIAVVVGRKDGACQVSAYG